MRPMPGKAGRCQWAFLGVCGPGAGGEAHRPSDETCARPGLTAAGRGGAFVPSREARQHDCAFIGLRWARGDFSHGKCLIQSQPGGPKYSCALSYLPCLPHFLSHTYTHPCESWKSASKKKCLTVTYQRNFWPHCIMTDPRHTAHVSCVCPHGLGLCLYPRHHYLQKHSYVFVDLCTLG